jgi:hypothetical protein
VVPDSDVWTPSDLFQRVYALGKELETRGAVVRVLKLPEGPEGGRVGLDDSPCAQSVEDLQALHRLALKHTLFAGTATWWKEWVEQKEEAPAGREPTVVRTPRIWGIWASRAYSRAKAAARVEP